jgi:hypothetical protein
MLQASADPGRTWSAARRLPEGVLGPIKNKPLELPNGELLCRSSRQSRDWTVVVERTGDLGLTWRTTPPLNDTGIIQAIQPTILRHGTVGCKPSAVPSRTASSRWSRATVERRGER